MHTSLDTSNSRRWWLEFILLWTYHKYLSIRFKMAFIKYFGFLKWFAAIFLTKNWDKQNRATIFLNKLVSDKDMIWSMGKPGLMLVLIRPFKESTLNQILSRQKKSSQNSLHTDCTWWTGTTLYAHAFSLILTEHFSYLSFY